MGVIEAPRVQLTNGLFRTIEKPTSLPTAATEYPSRRSAQSFNQGGRPKAGAELTRNQVRGAKVLARGDLMCNFFARGDSRIGISLNLWSNVAAAGFLRAFAR